MCMLRLDAIGLMNYQAWLSSPEVQDRLGFELAHQAEYLPSVACLCWLGNYLYQFHSIMV